MSQLSAKYEPLPRLYHVAERVGSKLLVQGGRTQDFSETSKQRLASEVETFDLYSELWERKRVEGDAPSPGTILAASASLHDDLFTFGGLNGRKYSNALHRFDSKTWRWCQLSPQNAAGAPIPKAGCGMVAFPNSLAMFGGQAYTWTDEFHLHNLRNGVWSCPATTGERPPPCSNFTFTAIDDRRAVLFGGYNGVRHQMNDVYIIDLHTLCWTKLNKSGGGPWPQERSCHAAVCLNYGQQYPQLLVTGGLDKQNKQLADVWILDLERGTWRMVSATLKPRWRHSLTAFSLGPGLTEVTMFGGSAERLIGPNRFEEQPKLADTTLLQFRLVESCGQSEWELLSVVDNSQRGSLERMVEKVHHFVEIANQREIERDRARVEKREAELERDRIRQEKWEVEGERDRARVEKREVELERDRIRQEKWVVEGERDRVRVEKREVELERDRVRQEKWKVEGERDRVRVELQQAQERADQLQLRLQGEGDRARAERREAESERDRVRMEKWEAENERDRARVELQQAHESVNRLQWQLYEIQNEQAIVHQQAIAAEQRGPSWEVKEDELEMTEERLGIGGWAEVRIAKLKVAAKCLHEQLDYKYHHDLFRREMNVAARVSHPNLLRFLGARLEGGMAILTELMPTSLRALVDRGHADQEHRLSRELILSIAIDVACALNYLHHMTPTPIVHRDLSSANVLLQPTPDGGWLAKVSDYGSANFQSQLQTLNPGSPVYSAPESNFPLFQSPKMDIYSFGVLLVEMCTCEFPVPERRAELIQSILYPQLVDLINRCLAEHRDRRPTAAELVKLLQAMQ